MSRFVLAAVLLGSISIGVPKSTNALTACATVTGGQLTMARIAEALLTVITGPHRKPVRTPAQLFELDQTLG